MNLKTFFNNKPSVALVGLAIFASALGQPTYAQTPPQTDPLAMTDSGTSVGNGTGGEREKLKESLRSRLGAKLKADRIKFEEAQLWCERVRSILRQQQDAARNANEKGNPESALYLLYDALLVISESLVQDPHLGGPLTQTLVNRGLELFNALDEVLPSVDSENPRRNVITKLHFLDSYVTFILDTERSFDTPHYLSYRYEHQRDRDSFERSPQHTPYEVEVQRLAYIRNQLQFVNSNHFIENLQTNPSDPRMDLRPISNRAYFKVAEIVAKNVAGDILENLLANRYGEVAEDLLYYSARIEELLNDGSSNAFLDVRDALNKVYVTIQGIVSFLGCNPVPQQSCPQPSCHGCENHNHPNNAPNPYVKRRN